MREKRSHIIPGSRKFECKVFWHWTVIALGISLDFAGPEVTLRFPFGFLRIGWCGAWAYNFDPKELPRDYNKEAKIKLFRETPLTEEEILGIDGDGQFVTESKA